MEEREFLRFIGQNVKRLRLAKGVSQVKLAHESDMEAPALSRLEAGRTNPTLLTMRKIAQALEVPLEILIRLELGRDDRDI
ncbi:helix-turn-helix transcriptional regulator [Nostoc sp. NIES-2111]